MLVSIEEDEESEVNEEGKTGIQQNEKVGEGDCFKTKEEVNESMMNPLNSTLAET